MSSFVFGLQYAFEMYVLDFELCMVSIMVRLCGGGNYQLNKYMSYFPML